MSGSRPKILYLSSSWPRGAAFGGQMRALHVGRALQKVGDVTLLVANASSPDEQAFRATREEFRTLDPIVALPTSSRGLIAKARRALDTRYLDVHGCQATRADQARLDEIISEYDLVWVLNSRTSNLLNRWAWPHAHLDIDDVPSTYLRTVAEGAARPLARWKARVQQTLLRRREARLSQRFTTLSVCSEEDRLYLGGGSHVHVIPNGFERPSSVPRPSPVSPPRIGFIGLYSYPPNLEGVRWFLRECWPLLRERVPGIRFRLIGKETDGPLRPPEPDTDALGFVLDPAAEIASWSLMIIPIRTGGGTRIKIADAFSRKCPVVSTTVGAFGYPVTDGRQLRLADSPVDFAQACQELIENRGKAEAIADTAWKEFLEKWTWEAIAPRVWTAAEDCLRRSRGSDPMARG